MYLKPEKMVLQKDVAYLGDNFQFATSFTLEGKDYTLVNDNIQHKSVLTEGIPKAERQLLALIDFLRSDHDKPYQFDVQNVVDGYGLFKFNYGPVSWGIQESGKFILDTYGEKILNTIPVLGYKTRRIEKMLLGHTVEDSTLLIEREVGNFSASYSTCFLTAAEQLLGVEVEPYIDWVRAVAIEMERIYNHLHVFGRLAEAASQNVAVNLINSLKERCLRLNSKYFFHRYFFGFNRLADVRVDLQGKARSELIKQIQSICREAASLTEYFLSSRMFLDRMQETGKLPREVAYTLGAVGPTARGSGIQLDDRLTFPFGPYNEIFVPIETEKGCDALARLLVRLNEIQSSQVVLQELLDRMPSRGTGKKIFGERKTEAVALSRIESPSGDLVHVLKLDADGRISFIHIRPPSLINFIPFAISMTDNLFTDFQFNYESFGLSFADSDR
ncbi:MAG: hypothetical protein QXV32_05500 [Conexivisphaerales archaeon]